MKVFATVPLIFIALGATAQKTIVATDYVPRLMVSGVECVLLRHVRFVVLTLVSNETFSTRMRLFPN